jgi:hypothetical protein
VDVTIPTQLTDDERKHWEALRALL